MQKKRNLCVLRVQPVDRKALSGRLYHLDEHEECADISRPDYSNFNISEKTAYSSYKEVKAHLEKLEAQHNKAVDEYNATTPKTKKRHMKKGSAQCIEIVASFSHDMESEIDIGVWYEAQKDFITKEYLSKGCEFIRLECHCDEETIHIHALLSCWDNDKQVSSANKFLGGKSDLSKLQDRYAASMEHLGLARGVSHYNTVKRFIRDLERSAGVVFRNFNEVISYCKNNHIEIPERAFHKSFRKYKNELDREVIASKEELQTVKEALDYYDVFEDGNAFMKQAHQDSKLLDELYKEYPDYYNELVSRVSQPEKDVSDLEER